MNNNLIIYHANCPDGWTAAWAAVKSLGDQGYELYPGYYGTDPPDVTGRDVYVVDFSYPRDKLLLMKEKARTLLVLDHHKTAEEDLRDLPFCKFDMNRSGAGLAWDELVKEPRPWIIDYVEDRDLWRFKLPDSQPISDYIMSTSHTLEDWDKLSKMSIHDVAFGGMAIRRKIDGYCKAMISNVYWETIHWSNPESIGPFSMRVPVVNAPQVMISDLLNHICNHFKSGMAVGWWLRGDGKYQYSLRSNGDIDVGAIAKEKGGGGHHNAAGFTADRRVI